MNIVSFRTLVPALVGAGPPIIFGEDAVMLELPGPYILGIQVWTDELAVLVGQVLTDVSDITLRLLEAPGSKIFPEASATIYTPVTQALRAQGLQDGWYHIAQTHWADFHIVVSGDPRNRVICELRNAGAVNINVIVNLKVAAKPPEETAIQLVREMNAGMERWQSASRQWTGDLVEAAVRQALTIKR